jgi:hypothetical protein
MEYRSSCYSIFYSMGMYIIKHLTHNSGKLLGIKILLISLHNTGISVALSVKMYSFLILSEPTALFFFNV